MVWLWIILSDEWKNSKFLSENFCQKNEVKHALKMLFASFSMNWLIDEFLLSSNFTDPISESLLWGLLSFTRVNKELTGSRERTLWPHFSQSIYDKNQTRNFLNFLKLTLLLSLVHSWCPLPIKSERPFF